MEKLTRGTAVEHRVRPTSRDLASSIGNVGVDVISTPATIGYLETTAHLLIQPAYGSGEVSVGTRVNVEHVSAATLGSELVCRAELTDIDGARYDFAVTAHQNGKLIMRGEHTRRVVQLHRFLSPQSNVAGDPPERTLTFWFDVHSPWCYLAALRIGDIARRHHARLRWMPIHLPTLIDTIEGRRPLEQSPAFVNWYRQDLQDWAALQGVKIVYHPDYPLRNSRALRCCVFADEQGCAEPFVQRVLRGYWSERADISSVDVLERFFRDVDLPPDSVSAVINAGVYKRAVTDNTEAAVERGVFGVPTVDTGDKLFFGNDRLDLLEHYLSRTAA